MKKQVSKGKISIYSLSILVAVVVVVLLLFLIHESMDSNAGEPRHFDRHYALITKNTEDEFWNRVYESAKEYAEDNNAYVEWFGHSLSGNYSVNELFKMAIEAGVDGVILQAADEDETRELIEESVNSKIPVVTVLSDCQESSRQAYIGLNNYEIGQLYGEKVLEIIKGQFRKNISIMIAAGGDSLTNMQSITLLGLREYLNENLSRGYFVGFETKLIEQSSSFATEAFFNTMFTSQKDIPDILICLDEKGTRCAYLASVDHNRVGDTAIIGYSYSTDILYALEKGVLQGLLSVDAETIGKNCTEALLDFQEDGHTNNYKIVTAELLGPEEAAVILEQRNSEGEESQ